MLKLYEKIEVFDKLNEDESINIYVKIICLGETECYFSLLEKRKITNERFLEAALVYGRYDILKHMLTDDFYINLLNSKIYDPYLLKNHDPCVTDDIYNGSWWSNDEYERSIVNKRGINHKICFDLLKKYNKQLDKDNILIWIELSNGQIKYYGGTYFPNFKILLTELLGEKFLSVINVTREFRGKIKNELLLKILTNIFNADEILNYIIE